MARIEPPALAPWLLFGAGILCALVLLLVPSASAQIPCPTDQVSATARGDTITVLHANAERNCCSTFTLAVEANDFVADFFEGEAEPYCHCTCCFDLRYDAHGFATGRWRVRVWDETGTNLFGEVEVDVTGNMGPLALGNLVRGACTTVSSSPRTWSSVRTLYR